jgi:beta-galactosidase
MRHAGCALFPGDAFSADDPRSNAGLLDLEGFRKPDAYLRQALASDKPMVYAGATAPGAADTQPAAGGGRGMGRPQPVERWGFPNDTRKTVPVEIISNCQSVEVFLNGRSLGEKPNRRSAGDASDKFSTGDTYPSWSEM